MRRVLVIGASGAGKTMLSGEIAARLGLPLVHLDKEFWLPNWLEPDRLAWRARVATLVAAPEWVIDGNYGGTLDQRIAAADTVIWLDYGRIRCIWRALLRTWRHLGRSRPDMATGCVERFDLAFLRYIWSFPCKHRPHILSALDKRPATCRLVRLARPADARRFLAELPGDRTAAVDG